MLAEVGDHVLLVWVHLALVNERVTCVGFDVRSFIPKVYEAGSAVAGWAHEMYPTNDNYVEITSPLIRGLKVAQIIERALTMMKSKDAWDERFLVAKAPTTVDLSSFDLQSVVDGFFTPADAGPRRGPKPQLDDEALRTVVAAAYRTGGRRPVQAVQAALEESGVLRPPVTIDQARKAVAAARARGFIPPAKRGRQAGGQS
ncbi:hypothetical protein [Blastococcus sp. TBT05-19]|uniref:hypothetical protein n=1 Tax=Blastococcus sp. TBT05-19 TaxID=2250581 RepID=UPI0011BDD808|nr:hypothetical protein [Blastococcus sp. TBT05-19]